LAAFTTNIAESNFRYTQDDPAIADLLFGVAANGSNAALMPSAIAGVLRRLSCTRQNL
jgi:hypothetical protein